MFFTFRDENGIARLHPVPPAVAINLACPGMNEHLVFPSVGVPGGMSPRGNLEYPHAKVVGAIILTDHHPGRNSFGGAAAKVSCLDVRIRDNLHNLPSE
jgi:hypothetical protein